MKDRKSCYNLISSIIITLMVSIMFATTSFAWFSIKDKSNLSFTAGSNDITLYSAMFEGEIEDGEYVWDDEGVDLEAVDSTFGDLYVSPDYVTHLGTIDNLAFRTEKNNLWYCLKVNKSTGDNFSLRLSLIDQTPYKIFTNLYETPTVLNNNAVNTKMDGLLESLIIVDSLIITDIDTQNFFESVDIIGPDEVNSDKLNVLKYSNNGAQSFVGDTSSLDLSNSNYFYLYFRVYPNLDAYANLVDYISEFMPCVIQFSLKISIVVDKNI